MLSEPVFVADATAITVGVWSNTFGVKLFRGIVGGGIVPNG